MDGLCLVISNRQHSIIQFQVVLFVLLDLNTCTDNLSRTYYRNKRTHIHIYTQPHTTHCVHAHTYKHTQKVMEKVYTHTGQLYRTYPWRHPCAHTHTHTHCTST